MKERLTAIVGARISEFRRKMAEVKKLSKTVPNKIVVNVEARVNNFQKTMNRVSNFIHSFDNIMTNAAMGSLMMVSPGAVPLIAVLVGLLGTLGPMMGVVGGSTFALASAFGFAGVAALAFGAAAIPTIAGVFGETEKLTKAQKAAKAEYTKFQKTWQSIVKDLEKPVLEAFGKSMQFANKTLKMARPLFDSAATAVNNLLDSLNASLDSPPVKAFFDYMNKSAGPMLETMGKAFGSFTQGFMSMMVAFGPLAEQTAQGFLNMANNFAEWATGLSKSEKFQSFVAYIQENMPKIRAIFRDALAGMTYLFAAFGPLSSDMMTSLQNMMGRFKEWAKALGDNQQFQKFIGYIRDNAPKVIELIGNLTDFLVNLGIGLAPIGSAVLDIVNNFLAWTNRMMEAHPWLGKMVGVMLILAGGFRMLLPIIIAFKTLFAGVGPLLKKGFTNIIKYFLPFKGSLMVGLKMIGKSIFNLGKTFLINAARIAGSFFIAMGPVGWVIATVIALVALIIANWDKVKSWTVKTWNNVVSTVKSGASKAASAVKSGLDKALAYVKGLGTSFYNAGKGFIEMMAKGITNAVGKVTSAVSNVAQKVRNFLPFSPAKDGPLSDLNKLDFAGPIKDSIARARNTVQRSMSSLLAMDSQRLSFDTSVNKGMNQFKHQLDADVSNFELPERDIVIVMDGREVGRGVEKYVSSFQDFNKGRRVVFE